MSRFWHGMPPARWRFQALRHGSADSRSCGYPAFPITRSAATVSISARPTDEPLPARNDGRRRLPGRAPAVARRILAHVDIPRGGSLEALWFSTVRVPAWWAVLPDRTWITAMAATRSPVYCNGEREPAIVPHAGSGLPVRARHRPTNPVAPLCIRSVRVNAGSASCAISGVDIHRRNPLAAL